MFHLRFRRTAVPGALLALAALVPAYPAAGADPLTRVRHLMGSNCAITIPAGPPHAEQAIEEAFDAIAALEASLSTYRPDSELSRVNARAAREAVRVSDDVAELLEASLHFARITSGAFDPTVGPLVAAWDLRGEGHRPDPAELEAARDAVGYRRVRWNPGRHRVAYEAPGLWIDPGAIGKGMGLDRAVARLRAAGIRSALLEFGGQVLALGTPPGEEYWTIAVADPEERGRPALLLRLRDASAATSAQSERGRQVAGEWIGHILDPRRGTPVPRCGSVTVVSRRATDADAVATALYVMGPDEGLSWAEGMEDVAVGYLLPGAGCGAIGPLRVRDNRRFRDLLVARRDGVTQDGDASATSPARGARRYERREGRRSAPSKGGEER